jgi:chitin synthase
LKFVKSAVGETDVPDTVPEFISQRRRWLNGAFFAAVYSTINAKQIWKTDHTLARKILLHIEFVYQTLNLVFTYFGLVSFAPYILHLSQLTCRRLISTSPSTSSLAL